ncbi:unnamed protein product [marine sediment metagenome]|uniref:HTH marR-type domain-containing protein n=1 Tax=marine sediment metagenome TaxID=412755 RepID=X1U4D1_9ZZZZ
MRAEKIVSLVIINLIIIIAIIVTASAVSFLIYNSGFLSANAYWGLSSIMIALISIAYELRSKAFQKSVLDFQKSIVSVAASLTGEQHDILRIIAKSGKIEFDKIAEKLNIEKSELNIYLDGLENRGFIKLRKEKNKKYYSLELK